jgi:2-polyprenyl-3-methyl-5-hydroxy-6-metoxy-1,4-benzoquinol methylase
MALTSSSQNLKMKTELLQHCNVCDGTTLEVVDAECNIARCQACGYIFDNPRPTLDELIDFYSRPSQYDSWLNEIFVRDRLWKRRLDCLRSTRKAGSLLDVGTGIGQFLALARNFYTSVSGTEVSSVAVQIAKEKYNLDLYQGTIETLRGQVFDNITLFHVLEHVSDPKSVLKTCHSLLSQGGILVVAVPNEVTSLRASLKRILARAGLRKQRQVGKFGLPRTSLEPHSVEVHLSHFTPKVLHRLLRATGFSILENTLDPYYVLTGRAKLQADIYYYTCLALLRTFRVNLYDTMLVIARKVDVLPDQMNGH